MADPAAKFDVFGIEYGALPEADRARIFEVKETATILLAQLAALGQSRELEQARNRLEEAVVWAVKHILRNC